MRIQKFQDFRDVLKSELEERCRKNPRYSLRAFSRDLGIANSRLSEVLSGRYGLSLVASGRIAARLNFNAAEKKYFCDLVEQRHARSRVKRELARRRLASSKSRAANVDDDTFALVSDWYHFAILELTYVKGFRSDPAWIARRMGVQEVVAAEAINRLIRLGLLAREGERLVAVDAETTTPFDLPSRARRHFHDQILEKARVALHTQNVDAREMSSVVFAFRVDQIAEAKAMLRRMKREFMEKFGRGEGRDSVYCFALQFFDLTEG